MKTSKVDFFRRVEAVKNLDTDNFGSLAAAAKLDPKYHFKHCNWSGVDFGEMDITGYDFSGSVFAGADLSRVKGFGRAHFEGADLEAAKVPESRTSCSFSWTTRATTTSAVTVQQR